MRKSSQEGVSVCAAAESDISLLSLSLLPPDLSKENEKDVDDLQERDRSWTQRERERREREREREGDHLSLSLIYFPLTDTNALLVHIQCT